MTEKDKDGFKHLSLALHCELHSTDFVIKQVETEVVTDLPVEEIAVLSSIFSIKPEAIVVERQATKRKVAIQVEARAIIRQLNSSLLLHNKRHSLPTMTSPHLMPVALAGGSIGTIAIVAALILFIILIIRR